jgi:hypothetical protein
MVGDADDMAGRMQATLPFGWFADDAPVLQAVLQGVGTAWASCYSLLQALILQSRISTATGEFLDFISTDFFATMLLRFSGELDAAFRQRILLELLRPRGTREAITVALSQLTGQTPDIFEPARTTDTGGYNFGGCGFGVAGGWGNLGLPFQFFITVYPPVGGGIANLAGYATGGVPVRGNLAMETAQLTDADLFAAIPPLLPAGTIAWARISS